jgi:hypothetical protein
VRPKKATERRSKWAFASVSFRVGADEDAELDKDIDGLRREFISWFAPGDRWRVAWIEGKSGK